MANNYQPETLCVLSDGATRPSRQSEGAAGYDLYAACTAILNTDCRVVPVSTGVHIAIPQGYVGIIHERSGLALRNNVQVAGGVIDSDYRGEVKVMLRNLGDAPHAIQSGDRIAQLVITPIMTTPFRTVSNLNNTDRGAGGFGSTGR